MENCSINHCYLGYQAAISNYNMACAYALLNEIEEAKEKMNLAFELCSDGTFPPKSHIIQDNQLEKIRKWINVEILPKLKD